jgi:hypothetical protein
MADIASWDKRHRNGTSATIRRRDWGDFRVLVNHKPIDKARRRLHILRRRCGSGRSSERVPPCVCGQRQGPSANLHRVGDVLPLVCHLCQQPLTVTTAGVFVPHDVKLAARC